MFSDTGTVSSAENSANRLKFSPMGPVLIVDDETLIRWSIAESLESAGFDVMEAGTAQAALQCFAGVQNGIAVVLLDLKLPDSNDLGLLRRIRDLAPDCRIILMTAHGSREVLDEALLAGAYDVLGKPFDMASVVGLVRQAAA